MDASEDGLNEVLQKLSTLLSEALELIIRFKDHPDRCSRSHKQSLVTFSSKACIKGSSRKQDYRSLMCLLVSRVQGSTEKAFNQIKKFQIVLQANNLSFRKVLKDLAESSPDDMTKVEGFKQFVSWCKAKRPDNPRIGILKNKNLTVDWIKQTIKPFEFTHGYLNDGIDKSERVTRSVKDKSAKQRQITRSPSILKKDGSGTKASNASILMNTTTWTAQDNFALRLIPSRQQPQMSQLRLMDADGRLKVPLLYLESSCIVNFTANIHRSKSRTGRTWAGIMARCPDSFSSTMAEWFVKNNLRNPFTANSSLRLRCAFENDQSRFLVVFPDATSCHIRYSSEEPLLELKQLLKKYSPGYGCDTAVAVYGVLDHTTHNTPVCTVTRICILPPARWFSLSRQPAPTLHRAISKLSLVDIETLCDQSIDHWMENVV